MIRSEEEIDILLRICRRYLDGQSLQSIADALNTEQVFYQPGAEFYIAIYGSLAQSESENISANVRWGKGAECKAGKGRIQRWGDRDWATVRKNTVVTR